MDNANDAAQVEFEAMVRRYALKLASRYAPVMAVGLAVVLLLIFVPTTQPSRTDGSGLASGTQLPNGFAAPQPGGTTGANSGGAAGATPTAAGSGALSAANGSTAPAPSGVTLTVPGGGATFAAGSATGVARTGVACGAGARQFSWSRYGPRCIAAFTGNNGGATAHGVTGTTITLSYRLANSAQQAGIDAAAGAANINQDALVADLRSYIAYFNTQFELYGRHVVLKSYQGTGDYIEEDQGQDLGATQADAVTAHDLGAFGDVTFTLEASQPYEEDLAAEHVISFSSVGLSQQWFDQHAPYEYSVQGATGTAAIIASAEVACRRLAGMPAIFSGDPIAQRTPRVFGVIYPETPVYAGEIDVFKARVASECGVKTGRVVGYPINFAGYEQESVSAVAQMKAAGVTTILCACDPIVPIFLTNAASQQNYSPEWFSSDFGDPIARDYNQAEWSHTIVGGIQFPPISQTEAYRTFQRGFPGKHPAEWAPTSPPYFYVAYYTLLHVFDGLQAAGPNLNPTTYEQGEFSLPASDRGDNVEAAWVFGKDVYDPVFSFGLAWWNQNAVSAFDNTKGAYLWCNGGATYYGDNLAALGGPHQQLNCFGK